MEIPPGFALVPMLGTDVPGGAFLLSAISPSETPVMHSTPAADVPPTTTGEETTPTFQSNSSRTVKIKLPSLDHITDKKLRMMVEKRCKIISEKYETILEKLRAEKTAAPPLLKELLACSRMEKHRPDKFSPITKDFSAQLYKISPKAYVHCMKHLPLPSRKTIQQFIRLEEFSRPADYVPPKKVKVQFTKTQRAILKAAYAVDKFPSRESCQAIADQCESGYGWYKVRKWFEKARELEKQKLQRIAAGLSEESEEEEEEAGAMPEPAAPPEKTQRSYLSTVQVAKLESWFAKNEYVRIEEQALVCEDVGCDFRKVKRWFENKRHKINLERRNGNHSGSAGERASIDS